MSTESQLAITVGNLDVGPESPPFIVAEMSGNHGQSLERALRLVDAAVAAGAHALKVQTASADGLTLNLSSAEFTISDPASPWYGRTLHELYRKAVLPWDWHRPIFDYCKERGIIAFSSPFEVKAVDLLEDLNVPCYKVASFELGDLQLLRRVARTRKPLLLSTGMASLGEIERAVETVRGEGNDRIILLKCTSTYPASPLDSNLTTIPHLRQAFGVQVGLSDHTLGVGAPCAAVALGAVVIEKHFTLSRDDGGVDAAFSLEPHELRLLVEETLRAWQALGAVRYGGTENERASLQFRRSIYVCADIEAGAILSHDNIRVVRPGFGLPPYHLDTLIGRRVNRALRTGTAMAWDYIG